MNMYSWEEKELYDEPIEKIVIKSNGSYMRGLKIFYRNGTNQIFNTEDGGEAGVVHFAEGDVFVGMKILLEAAGSKVRKMGISVIRRNGELEHTEPVGTSMTTLQPTIWPEISTLEGRQDVSNMKIV